MKLVDTHCHLTFPQYDNDRDIIIKDIFKSNISWVLNACSQLEDLPAMKELSKKFPEKIYLSIGIHPHYASQVKEDAFAFIEQEIKTYPYKAIGEVGIDLFRNLSPLLEQEHLFKRFIHLAIKYKKPLIIHSRNADLDLIRILDESNLRGNFVVHCFSGNVSFAREIIDRGGKISFTANITYKNSGHIKEVVKFIPLEYIMLETDSPYLPPQHKRGARNTPLSVIEIAKCISELKNTNIEVIAEETTKNAQNFFNILTS